MEPAEHAGCIWDVIGTRLLVTCLLLVVTTSTIVLLAPSTVGAKEGVEARLDRAIPDDALAGSLINVGWSLGGYDPDGAWRPFTALGVFVRVTGPDNETEEAYGTEDWIGHFSADVAVPSGGIADVQIGLAGTDCHAEGCWRSDALFPITGIGLPAGVPVDQLYQARVDPIYGPLSAEEAIPVRVTFWPRPGVAQQGGPGPVQVFVRWTKLDDGSSIDVPAHPTDQRQNFVATISFPAVGRYSLQAAIGDDGRVDRVLDGSLVEIGVGTEAGTAAEAAISPESRPAAPNVLPWLLVGSTVVLAAILLLARQLRYRSLRS